MTGPPRPAPAVHRACNLDGSSSGSGTRTARCYERPEGLGLWRPKPDGWGTLWLTTTGRRSGRRRQVVLGYFEDGDNLVTMAMNGWGAPEPAWWLNLQAQPDGTLRTRDGERNVRARRAQGAERERLWARWAEIDKNLDAYAAMRPAETAVVVFESARSVNPAGNGQ